MCTRFVYRGDDTITGFNFEIDLAVWDHKIITEKDRFYIGILRPDGVRHSYHGVNCNGNVGTLLYVHGNSEGAHQNSKNCMTIADLTEQFVQAKISFDDALQIVQERKIVYAPDATMQALTEEDYLFRQPSGDPMVPTTFTFRFKKILKENGLPQNLSVHSLRHTNASLLIAQGVDVRTVAGLLGHSQPSTTLDIYAHAFDKTKREAQEKPGKVMGL